ncbi:hypothetical protein GALL_475210 [mine drainage metagenome]|uniref:DUF3024 domain-containing protein n=1 Tax=mine drainage metagenome TaxID=410659 RepID=A0A1J5Q039_9ZZZZ
MNALAGAAVSTSTQIVDLVQRRLERALRSRARYRYVQPRVLHEERGFRIQSPCCSHNVDPHGGLIDIALLVPQPQGRWSLCARDHASSTWVPRLENGSLDAMLNALCTDSQRQFWP